MEGLLHLRITVVSFYLPPKDRIGAGVQMHMLANAYAALGHEVTVVSPTNHKESDANYTLSTVQLDGRNRILKWSRALKDYKFEADIVHFGGDDHLVFAGRRFVHLRTFHGSCFAEAQVASKVANKVRMVYLGITELLAQRSADVCAVVSAHTNRYFPDTNIVIPNGVDLLSFSASATKSDVPTILFVVKRVCDPYPTQNSQCRIMDSPRKWNSRQSRSQSFWERIPRKTNRTISTSLGLLLTVII